MTDESRRSDGGGGGAVPLHPLEVRVLDALGGGSAIDFERLATDSGLTMDQLRRALSWLGSKGMISVSESITQRLSLTDPNKPPAELSLVEVLEKAGGQLPLEEVKKRFESSQEFSAAIGRASSAGWVTVEQREKSGERTLILTPKSAPGAKLLRNFIDSIHTGVDQEKVPADLSATASDLLRRGILRREESRRSRVSITGAGKTAVTAIRSEARPGTTLQVAKITPEIVARIRSSGQNVVLRPIDVEAPPPRFYPGRRHPVKEFIDEVREVYLSMGFSEIAGDSIQSSFWNFDALFTPQDHPAREMQDTFYIKGGRAVDLVRSEGGGEAEIVDRVASTHENGWETGSGGWGYRWDIEEARRLVLRTHNTALTIRATAASRDAETRVFSVGRVYRNENLDFKHLAELHQMEGIVIGDGLNLRDLMGILIKFYSKLGMPRVKLWPSFFPYTEPSMQVMTYHERLGKWLEMGGSGVFRPEVTRPLGVKKPVLAWGCGLERLLMLRLDIHDIRALYLNDLDWLRVRRDIASTEDILR